MGYSQRPSCVYEDHLFLGNSLGLVFIFWPTCKVCIIYTSEFYIILVLHVTISYSVVIVSYYHNYELRGGP